MYDSTPAEIAEQMTAASSTVSNCEPIKWPHPTWHDYEGETMPDNVNHPPHYKQGDIECIDAIRAALTPEEFRGYCKGNMLKYTWRERHKGGDESVQKALWYGNKLLEVNNGSR